MGFVNYGTFDAVVKPWTWIPLGTATPERPVDASTVSSANDGTSNGVYVEVSCLPRETYTLRIEALAIDGGGGGVTVPASWFAFRK